MKNLALLFAVLLLTGCAGGNSDDSESSYTSAISESSAAENTTAEETTVPIESSETSSVTEITESRDEIDILELPDDRYCYNSPIIMPPTTEFTVDLKEMTPETDLFALTNMKKYSLGDEPLMIDLDGDGTDEELFLIEEESGNDWRELFITINGKEYAIDFSVEKYNQPNEIYFCDIDSSDNYTEIACRRSVLTNDYCTSFYRYESGELYRIFAIDYDTPDGEYEADMFLNDMNASVTGKPIITDGSGIITAARRLNSQTWLAYCHYKYYSESGRISLVCEPVYPYYYENIDNFSAAETFTSEYYSIADRPLSELTREITVYKEPNINSETLNIVPQRIYFTSEYVRPGELYEYELWVYITAQDGTSGWLSLPDGTHLEESNGGEIYYNVFTGLVFYD